MNNNIKYIKDQFNDDLLSFIDERIGLADKTPIIIETSSKINLSPLEIEADSVLINLKTINNIKETNDFLKAVNWVLEADGIYACLVESYRQRRIRLKQKYRGIFLQVYLLVDFLFKRVFPKIKPTRRIYRFISADRNRSLSLTEALGRLVYCGFEIVSSREIKNLHVIIARKNGVPLEDPEPSTGIILKMPRKGQFGEEITVYKLRTMHPYAQYIQDYVYYRNHLREGGKFKNDFRISGWGRKLRKLMVDEFPMLINVLKGDIKLFGIRSLSAQYLSLYPEDLQERRLQYKPGFLPPYHADNPNTFEEILESERRYLDAYDRAPLMTDIRYLCKALYNIFLKGVNSSAERKSEDCRDERVRG